MYHVVVITDGIQLLAVVCWKIHEVKPVYFFDITAFFVAKVNEFLI